MERSDARPGRTRGWVVGEVAGAPVVVSPGWLIAAVVLTVVFAPSVRTFDPSIGSGAYAVAAVGALLLFGSVFLHELAHALVARRSGVVVHEIAVTLLGGHTRMGAAASRPGTSALIAVVGPLANLALAAAAWAATLVMPAGSLATWVVSAAALANGFVGAFNLVPGLPLDGGRVLEALVWRLTGRRSAGTVVAGWVGRAVAVLVVAWFVLPPLVSGRPPDLVLILWGVLVGGFLWSGAARSIQAARAEEAVDRVTVRGLMRPAFAVPASTVVADLDAGTGAEAVLVGPDGRPRAYADVAALAAVPAGDRRTTPITAVAVLLPPEAVVDADLTGRAAVQAVGQAARHAPVMVAVDRGGRVVGLLRAQDVITALRPGAGAGAR